MEDQELESAAAAEEGDDVVRVKDLLLWSADMRDLWIDELTGTSTPRSSHSDAIATTENHSLLKNIQNTLIEVKVYKKYIGSIKLYYVTLTSENLTDCIIYCGHC